jgi:hypothetical protein
MGGAQGGGATDGGAGAGGDASGSGDSLEGLDEALDGSLEDFDDAIANSGSSGTGPDTIDILTRSGSAGGQSEGPLFEEGDISEADGPIENSDIEQRAGEGAPPSGEASESTQTASTGSGQGDVPGEVIPIPEDIDDGQGDSIVLRQIRDAAMKEQDPVLREKLWDEYRRIKNQG